MMTPAAPAAPVISGQMAGQARPTEPSASENIQKIRGTEPLRPANGTGALPSTPENKPRNTAAPTQPIQQVTPPAPPRPAAASPSVSTPPPPKVTAKGNAESLSFSIPEQGSLFSNLTTGMTQFFRDFGKPKAKLKPGDTGDFQFLLDEQSLSSRLGGELTVAYQDFRRDPGTFVKETLRGEGNSKRRQALMQAGIALGLVVYAFIFTSMFLLALFGKKGALNVSVVDYANTAVSAAKVTINDVTGRFNATFETNENGEVAIAKLAPGRYKVKVEGSDCDPQERDVEVIGGDNAEQFKICPIDVAMIDATKPEAKAEKVPKEMQGKGGFTGGSKPKIEQAGGGGGGGMQRATPVSKGVPPKASLNPPVLLPNPEPPKVPKPSLPVVPTVLADPKALPQMKGPVGDLNGLPAPPSAGMGSGGGMGNTGKGGGAGDGDGQGYGPGRGMNAGGGDPRMGGGDSTGGSSGILPISQVSTKPVLVYFEKAKYTEEARQNKIQGAVLVSVVINADGSIGAVRAVRGLPDGLTEKAIEAAKRCKFRPATKNGVPVATRQTLEFSFNIY
jgi:TonB family protein